MGSWVVVFVDVVVVLVIVVVVILGWEILGNSFWGISLPAEAPLHPLILNPKHPTTKAYTPKP